jgi:hypothetical protein
MITNKADAENKWRELLPPKKKARLLDTNAAAQKKHRESLSPDDKVQILKKDAAAHTKTTRVSLSQQKSLKFKQGWYGT